MGRRKVVDTCILYNELDLLEIRLNVLDPYVDHFVICESDVTFTGIPKPLHFWGSIHRFSKWLDKITYVRALLPQTHNAWQREHDQRRAIMQGLPLRTWKNEDPIVLLSDVDEIPDLKGWEPRENSCWWLRFHYYYVNVAGIEPQRIKGTCSIGWSTIHLSHKSDLQDVRDWRHHWAQDIRPAGWHFSYMGGPEQISHKLAAFAHTEVSHHNTRENIVGALKDTRDLFGRHDHHLEVVSDEGLPEWLLANKARYSHLWMPNDKNQIA